MNSFRHSGQSSEDHHALGAEREFRIAARRNKLLGQWAAERLGLDDEATRDYVARVIAADMAAPGHDDVVAAVLSDLRTAGIVCDDEEVRRKLLACESEARAQIAGT